MKQSKQLWNSDYLMFLLPISIPKEVGKSLVTCVIVVERTVGESQFWLAGNHSQVNATQNAQSKKSRE